MIPFLSSAAGEVSKVDTADTTNSNRVRDGIVFTNSDPNREALLADREPTDSSSEGEENEPILIIKEERKTYSTIRATTNDHESSPSLSPAPLIEVTSVHPFQMLRTPSFYHLWSMMLLAGFSVSFIATLFKVFGLTFIDDDQFLATVGSMSAIFNCAGRIVWGLVADKFSYRLAHISKSGIMTISLLTFYSTSAVGKPMFFIWVCVIFFCVGGIFSIYPTSIAHTFGPKYMSINYGLLFTSQACSGVIAAVLFTTLLDLLEWEGMIFLISGFSTIEFVLALLYYYEQHCRRPPVHSHQHEEQ